MTPNFESNNFAIPTDGLVCIDAGKVQTKLELLQAHTPDELHLVLDFDRTLTVALNPDDDGATTWQILMRHLPTAGQDEYHRLYAQYRPLEISGDMDAATYTIWRDAVLDLFVQNKVSLLDIEKDFLDSVNIRPGAVELLRICRQLRIPTVILSAGVKDVIDILLAAADVQADLVLSTQLLTDDAGKVIGWDPETVVNTMTKRESSLTAMSSIRRERPFCILVGDSLEDADMADGDANVLRVRVIDPRAGERKPLEQELAQTYERFDAAITDNSLQPIVEIIGQLTTASERQ